MTSFYSITIFPYYSSLIFFYKYFWVYYRFFSWFLKYSATSATGNCGNTLNFYTSLNVSVSSSILAFILLANLFSSVLVLPKNDFSYLFSIFNLAFSSNKIYWWCFKFLDCYCITTLCYCKNATSYTKCSVIALYLWV
jgi:hypothetical protein